MGHWVILERHAPLPRFDVHLAHESQDLAVRHGVLLELCHLVVKLWEPLHELLRTRAGLKLRGHQALHRDVIELQAKARLPSKRSDLPSDIHARQVVPWVGLREPVLLGGLHDLTEFVPGLEVVKDVREGAREDAFDALDPIPSVHQVLDGGDNGQAGPHGGLVKVVHLPPLLEPLDGVIPLERPRVHLLVWGNDVDPSLHPRLVVVRDKV
mmetsp:Transcript_8784/g.31668  ORF Transcript_8784/g.31668 Transcript_8784/m.31668 type:complete len:211 (-) Transcript_8784:2128-2760(-)